MLHRNIIMIALLIVHAPAAVRGWAASPSLGAIRVCSHVLPRSSCPQLKKEETFIPSAATGETIPDVEKTDGIPNYMLKTAGTITRLVESPESSAAVKDDGVLYEDGRTVAIVTSDVIDMVQQQGGAAEKIDFLGENILVDGMLFDGFMAGDTFEIAPADSKDGDTDDVLSLDIVEHRPSSALDLSQLGEDDSTRQSITAFLELAVGFTGWSARVARGGRVQAGFKIAKRTAPEPES